MKYLGKEVEAVTLEGRTAQEVEKKLSDYVGDRNVVATHGGTNENGNHFIRAFVEHKSNRVPLVEG